MMEKFISIYTKVLMYEARFIIMAICLGQFVYGKDAAWSILGIMLVTVTGIFKKSASKQQGKVVNMICVAALLAMYWIFCKCYFGL